MDQNRNQIEEIKERLDIVQVVEKYVELRQTGKNYSGRCPFHQEKTPSFIVSPDIQRYKCFGCGKSGDIFNFIQEIENLDFPETLEKLAKQAGVELKKTHTNSKFKRLEEINYLATKYYYKELKADKIASAYIKERQFKDEIVKEFGIGYAPRYPKLLDYLQTEGKFNKTELLESGLFTLKEDKVREKFYDRIMFPIRSTRGKVVGFSGRVMPGNDYGPKYMNTPETPIFHKKDNLFGLYESRQEIRKQDLVILCEGQTDVISAHQVGLKNIVAPLGTGLTKEQVEKLSKFTKNLLFLFDDDSAGQQAVERGFKIASELNVYPFANTPKPAKDLDEYIKDGRDIKVFTEGHKQDAFSYLVSSFISDLDLGTLEGRNKTFEYIEKLLSTVKDSKVLDYYRSKAAKLTKIKSYNSAPQNKSVSKQNKKNNNIAPHGKGMKLKTDIKELYYIQYLTMLDKVTDEDLLDPEHITDPDLNKIYAHLYEEKDFSTSKMYEHFTPDDPLRSVLEDLIFSANMLPQDQPELRKELQQIKKELHKESLTRKSKKLSIDIGLAEENNDTKKSNKLLKEYQELNLILNKLKDDRDSKLR
jgi:DNA primase